jgi:hypothetical protein
LKIASQEEALWSLFLEDEKEEKPIICAISEAEG